METFPGLTGDQWLETAAAAAVVVASVIAARLILLLLRPLLSTLMSRAVPGLAQEIASAVRGALVLFVFVQALALAARTLSYLDPHRHALERWWLAGTIAAVSLGVQRLTSRLLTWYAARPGGANARLDQRTVPLVRRGANVAIVVAAALTVLGTLGVEISPLLAGLGIGGIAVALALQPLLVNLFASSYMLSDASVRVGDVIEVTGIPGALTGTVQDIGWRATRLLDFDNNVVIVPNSTLAAAVVRNYSTGDAPSDARVDLVVDHLADLAVVEAVLLDEARRIRDTETGAVTEREPDVRFLRLRDGNVECMVKVRAVDWEHAQLLRHVMLRRLHGRMNAEGLFPASAPAD